MQRISLKLFKLVERKEMYNKLVVEHGLWHKKVKSDEQQRYEQTRRVLKCTPLTMSVSLDYTDTLEDGSKTIWCGSATRMRNGWFRIILENDSEFKVREDDLLNQKVYNIKVPEKIMTSEEREKLNRKVKRQSKHQEEEMVHRRKEEAACARKQMLHEEMEKIVEYSQHGFLNKKCLEELIRKATEPFTHKRDGYETVVNSNTSSCVSVLSLEAVNTVLSDKRKADQMSRIEALHRKQSSKKPKRTPNTTRSDDGVIIRENLWHHDSNAAEENQQKQMKKLEKQVEGAQGVLTEWETVLEKRRRTAEAKELPINDASLWTFLVPKSFTAAERKVILRLCAPESKVISKGEREHLDVFKKENVTYLKVLAAVEGKKIELTELKKQLADIQLDREAVHSDLASVQEAKNDYEIDFIDDDVDLLEM